MAMNGPRGWRQAQEQLSLLEGPVLEIERVLPGAAAGGAAAGAAAGAAGAAGN